MEDLITSKTYKDLRSVFSQSNAKFKFLHRDEDQVIELEPEKTPLFVPLYNFFEHQLEDLFEYIDENLANRFISPLKSSAGALILFIPKPDDILRLCVDNRRLNAIMMKNRYFLLLIDEIFDRLSCARVFTKIDVKNAYYCF